MKNLSYLQSYSDFVSSARMGSSPITWITSGALIICRCKALEETLALGQIMHRTFLLRSVLFSVKASAIIVSDT